MSVDTRLQARAFRGPVPGAVLDILAKPRARSIISGTAAPPLGPGDGPFRNMGPETSVHIGLHGALYGRGQCRSDGLLESSEKERRKQVDQEVLQGPRQDCDLWTGAEGKPKGRTPAGGVARSGVSPGFQAGVCSRRGFLVVKGSVAVPGPPRSPASEPAGPRETGDGRLRLALFGGSIGLPVISHV